MNMRDIIDLIESEDVVWKWWLNVTTGEFLPVKRAHGDVANEEPGRFGITPERIEQIKQQHPDLDPEGDGFGDLSWWELVRYEAQKNGWVRIGSEQEMQEVARPYIYAANFRDAKLAVRLMMAKGIIVDSCEIEITNPQEPVEGYGEFIELPDERQIKRFLWARKG